MKRLLKAVFWRDNSDRGMLFGIALSAGAATFFFVGLVVLSLLTLANVDVSRVFSLYLPSCLCVTVALILYGGALSVLFLMDLFVQVLQCRKWVAVLLGLVAGSVGFAICAWKLKNAKACVFAVLSLIGFIISLVFRFVLKSGFWMDFCMLVATVLSIVALCSLIPRRSLQRFGTGVILLLLINFITPSIVLTRLSSYVEARAKASPEKCGATLTSEMLRERMGLFDTPSPLPEPFETLRENSLDMGDSLRMIDPFVMPSEETLEEFLRFQEENAAMIQLFDAITNPNNPYTGKGYPKAFSVPPEINVGSMNERARYYEAKMIIAAHHGDRDTVVDVSRRLRGMKAYFDSGKTLVCHLLAIAINGMHQEALQAALYLFSDDDLAELQQNVSVAIDEYPELLINVVYGEYVLTFDEALNEVFTKVQERRRSNRNKAFHIWFLFEQLSRIGNAEAVCAILKDTSLSEAERYAKAIQKTNTRTAMPIAKMFHIDGSWMNIFALATDNARAAEVGIAVERYLRKYDQPPETLEQLVPEFLDTVPISAITGKPFLFTVEAI